MAEFKLTGTIAKEKSLTGSINKGIGMGELPSARGLREFPSPAYSVNGADLAAVGEAIAEKTGAEKPVFPDGWKEAVEGATVGGVGKLICDAVIDVPESDTALDITIDDVVTENATGDIYVTIFEFLGEIPTDTTRFTAYAGVTMNFGHANTMFSDNAGGVAHGVNAGNKTANRYASTNVICVRSISRLGEITVMVNPTSASYATCRGQWRMRCYKVLTM